MADLFGMSGDKPRESEDDLAAIIVEELLALGIHGGAFASSSSERAATRSSLKRGFFQKVSFWVEPAA